MFLAHVAIPPVVLVVEDEFLLRMLAVSIVEDAGYTSVEAVNADEALAILESRSDICIAVHRYPDARRHGRTPACTCGPQAMAPD